MNPAFNKKLRLCFAASGSGHQIEFLSRIVSLMTICARNSYLIQDKELKCLILQQYDETINRLSGQIESLLYQRSERYPDDVFINILIDHFEPLPLKFEWIQTELQKALSILEK